MIEDVRLVPKIDISHAPVSGWRIDEQDLELYHDGTAESVDLGFVRSNYGNGYSGIQRDYRARQRLRYSPADWSDVVGGWSYLMFPTAAAESAFDFLVVNCYDSAAFTCGFIQLAAHTDNDLLPFVKILLEELPGETSTWFPELRLIDGRVSYSSENRYIYLDEWARPLDDGQYTRNWMVGRFMHFLNPNRTAFDREELHSVARWVEWSTTSHEMRKLQVINSKKNMIASVEKLHLELLQRSQSRFPNGVDGMRCDLLAAAIPIPHRTESLTSGAVDALLSSDPLRNLFSFSYRDGTGRSSSVKWGFQMVREELASMTYDYGSHSPNPL